MTTAIWRSLFALVCLVAALGGLLILDQTRGGPATVLSRCNLSLARVEAPAATVLIIGSSRSGVALDPVAMQALLQTELRSDITVERIAIGNVTLRVSHALLDTYLRTRGTPDIVLLEASFMTPRTISRLAPVAGAQPPEHYLLARDVNLMTFRQLLTQPAVAMPYTEAETATNQWRFRLRGAIARAGALVYEFASAPMKSWNFDACSRTDITREATWSQDFSFAYGDFTPQDRPADLAATLKAEILVASPDRALKDWQSDGPSDRIYPFAFDEEFRQGELSYLSRMAQVAAERGAQVMGLPLPLYGYEIDPADIAALEKALPEGADIFDLYGATGVDLRTYWFDDAHLEKDPAGRLTTAVMASHLASVLPSGDTDD